MLLRRQLDMLIHLINSTEPLSGKALAHIFQVDIRTVRSDIKKINSFLQEYQICVHSSNQFGYKIEKEDVVKFHQIDILHIIKEEDSFEMPQTPNERISYLFFLLSQGKSYHIEELADILYISIASIYNDLHVIKRFMEKRFKGLHLESNNDGLEIIGEEAAKRNLLSGIVAQRYHHLLEQKYSEYINPSGAFLDTVYTIIELMTIHKDAFSFRLSGEGLYSFASDVSLCVEREKKQLLLNYRDSEEIPSFQQLKEFLCHHMCQLPLLNKDNWSYLQDRFFAKEFIKKARADHEALYADFIRNIQIGIQQRFHIEILMDDKSQEYMNAFLNTYMANEEKSYYVNEDDKYEIMQQYPSYYLLSLWISYLVHKKGEHHFHTTYLSKCTLVLAESFLRNVRKKTGVLITNKDKAHILCLLHKLVMHFGNAIDLLEYGTLYDVEYGLLDMDAYDVVISTEAIKDRKLKDYIKISSLCSAKDILKVSEYLEQIKPTALHVRYEIEVVHAKNDGKLIKDYVISYIESCENIDILDKAEWVDWELEECFWMKIEHTTIWLISPFLEINETKLYHLLPRTSLFYKKKEITDVKLLVINSMDLRNLDSLLCE